MYFCILKKKILHEAHSKAKVCIDIKMLSRSRFKTEKANAKIYKKNLNNNSSTHLNKNYIVIPDLLEKKQTCTPSQKSNKI